MFKNLMRQNLAANLKKYVILTKKNNKHVGSPRVFQVKS